MDGKRGCGHNDLDFFGLVRVIKIQSIFIVELQRGIEKNQIMGIKDGQKSWKVKPNEVATIVINYYQKLFTSERIDPSSCVLNHVPIVIIEEMRSSLCHEFKEEEVLLVLKQMAPLKTPGLDGMPPLFYQHFWSIVDKDVTTSVLSWLNSRTLPHP